MIGEERQSLFLAHRDAVRRFARRISTNADDAEDMLQDVAVVVFGHHTGPPDAELFVGWCCAVARNLAAHRYRSEARRRRDAVGTDVAYAIASEDPESSAIARERLAARLARVNSVAISLLRDRFVFEETSEEIASRLNLSAACVRMRLARTMAVLRID